MIFTADENFLICLPRRLYATDGNNVVVMVANCFFFLPHSVLHGADRKTSLAARRDSGVEYRDDVERKTTIPVNGEEGWQNMKRKTPGAVEFCSREIIVTRREKKTFKKHLKKKKKTFLHTHLRQSSAGLRKPDPPVRPVVLRRPDGAGGVLVDGRLVHDLQRPAVGASVDVQAAQQEQHGGA